MEGETSWPSRFFHPEVNCRRDSLTVRGRGNAWGNLEYADAHVKTAESVFAQADVKWLSRTKRLLFDGHVNGIEGLNRVWKQIEVF